MMHKPIHLQEQSLIYPHKTCFEAFSARIHFGDRIAIIGRNGVGKSSLLKMLCDAISPSEGLGYLPQIIEDFSQLSGGQRRLQLLNQLLAGQPDLLLLDEPSNHLDSHNRRCLIRSLQAYSGTLIVVSHDIELIEATTEKLWHIEAPAIHVFTGSYWAYQQDLRQKKEKIDQELTKLSQQKKQLHLSLMKEQARNKRAASRGEKQIEQRKWPTIRSHAKLASAVKTGDKRLAELHEGRQQLRVQQARLSQAEVIRPKFKLKHAESHKPLIMIQDACVSYCEGPLILENLNFQLGAKAGIAICGDNGSGKSTLIKAILSEPLIDKTGHWLVPKPADLGYLDQHYAHLPDDKTVQDLMLLGLPKASYAEVRSHLNDFLFRKNEEVQTLVKNLSGGEKVRLSLALIAANPPKLLMLDEVTNNLDLETREHVIQVLAEFPGALITISHDEAFLGAIGIERRYLIREKQMLEL